jgi:maltose alpha-D-glucosyltransferase/alpha-amylase
MGPRANPYGFSFFDQQGLGNIMEFVDEYGARYRATRRAGYICMFSGNHDTNPRLAKGRSYEDLKLAFTFLLTMPGVPKIYYGDEIGMAGVPGLPSKEGGYLRTEVRTPMQWDHSANAGFSSASADKLYLPVESDPGSHFVSDQDQDPASLLNTIRELVQLRRQHAALGNASHYQVVYAQPGRYPFAFVRQGGGESILVVLNPANHPVEVDLSAEALPASLAAPLCLWGIAGGLTRSPAGWKIALPGVSAGIYQI